MNAGHRDLVCNAFAGGAVGAKPLQSMHEAFSTCVFVLIAPRANVHPRGLNSSLTDTP